MNKILFFSSSTEPMRKNSRSQNVKWMKMIRMILISIELEMQSLMMTFR